MKTRKGGPWFVAIACSTENAEREAWLRATVEHDKKVPGTLAVLYLGASARRSDWGTENALPWEGLPAADKPSRAVLVWDSLPVDVTALSSWKDYFLAETTIEHTVCIIRPETKTLDRFKKRVKPLLCMGESENAEEETPRIKLGDYVQIPESAANSLLQAAFVTLSFGAMEETVEQLSYWRARYLEQIRPIDDASRKEFHGYLGPILQRREENSKDDWEEQEQQLASLRKRTEAIGITEDLINPSALPVLLLTGETGTGKTLIASYLARLSADASLPFFRVPVPEYEASEHLFEHEVFGFRGGSFSDAPPAGDFGVLLKNIGGVVFLDEIGDASPATQRKLLAYLDDYKVRPRGVNECIYCPTMVVAATNCDLPKEVDERRFRRDLFMRFDGHIRVPSLNERKPDLDFILDTVLQDPGVNPGRLIRAVSSQAYSCLKRADYADGNFRHLENTFRAGVRQATRNGRTLLLKKDLSGL